MIYLGNNFLITLLLNGFICFLSLGCFAQNCFLGVGGKVLKQNEDHLIVEITYFYNDNPDNIVWWNDSSVRVNRVKINATKKRFFLNGINKEDTIFEINRNYIFQVRFSCGNKRAHLEAFFFHEQFSEYAHFIEINENKYISDCKAVMECLGVDCFFMCPKKRK